MRRFGQGSLERWIVERSTDGVGPILGNMPSPQVRAQQKTAIHTAERDIRRCGQHRALGIVAEDVEWALSGDAIDPIGTVAGNEQIPLRVESQPVGHGFGQFGDQAHRSSGSVDVDYDARHTRLDQADGDIQVSAVRGEHETVWETGQARLPHLPLTAGRYLEQTAVILLPLA